MFLSFLFFVLSSLGGVVCLLVSLLWCGLGSSWRFLFVCLGWMVMVLVVSSGVESASECSDRSAGTFFWCRNLHPFPLVHCPRL